jgi:pimeloyl-ACP methyl ester carboxylesterase
VGCGLSDKPDASYAPEYFAEFILAYLDRYKIKRADFVASSWGGGHALYFALKHPERVGKLVLSSPCGFPHEMGPLDQLLALPIIGEALLMCGNESMVRDSLREAFFDKSFATPELVDSVFKPIYGKGGLAATARSYRNADFSFVERNIDKIAAPTLLIWGKEDAFHPEWMAEEMHRRIKGSALEYIPDSGHLPHEETPEAFNERAMAFLVEVSPPRAESKAEH